MSLYEYTIFWKIMIANRIYFKNKLFWPVDQMEIDHMQNINLIPLYSVHRKILSLDPLLKFGVKSIHCNQTFEVKIIYFTSLSIIGQRK